jgi:hypothetical protein
MLLIFVWDAFVSFHPFLTRHSCFFPFSVCFICSWWNNLVIIVGKKFLHNHVGQSQFNTSADVVHICCKMWQWANDSVHNMFICLEELINDMSGKSLLMFKFLFPQNKGDIAAFLGTGWEAWYYFLLTAVLTRCHLLIPSEVSKQYTVRAKKLSQTFAVLRKERGKK